jgi:arylsulfatase A-like enzyme
VTSNAPLRSGKGSLYEGGVRVPLIVRWPGIVSAGSSCNTPVVSTDLCPTIAQIAEADLDERKVEQLDGRSLLPVLKDPNASLVRDALFFHYPHYYSTTTPVSAIRAGNWKMLEYFEDSRVELYDLAQDLGETTNLSSRRPNKTAELRDRLRSWREQVGAQMPEEVR